MSFSKKTFIGLFLAVLLGIQPAFAAGLNIIRDEEIEQALKTMTKPVLDQAGLSSDTVNFVLLENPSPAAICSACRRRCPICRCRRC
ncbi:MAG: hypothetical protein K8R48_02640 [Alphaproteobacteria bacterium]|nr:hypothetical protein [Alphaproteobacteria bacterium]